MAAGGSMGPLLTLAMTAVGIFGMVASSRARRARRKSGAPKVDPDLERLRAERAEVERRMAAYLASRPGRTNQED